MTFNPSPKRAQKGIHDLNNHLAVIKLYAQIGLRHPGLPKELVEGFHTIIDEVTKLKQVCHDEIELNQERFDITQLKRTEQALAESEEKYSVAFHSSPYAQIITRLADGYILDVNASFETITGFTSEELRGTTTIAIKIWGNEDDRVGMVSDLRNNIKVADREYSFRKKTGEIRNALFFADIINIQDEPFILASFSDITDHKRAQQEQALLTEHLMQARKMETIGRLAGGVAHEFNNALQIIKTYAELSLLKAKDGHGIQSYLEQIISSTRQSSEMVNQLLTFARKQTVHPERIKLNRMVGEMIVMLQRLVGDTIRVEWAPGEDLWALMIDPNQMNQCLVNLLLNARDAIAGEGRIILTTSNESFTENATLNDEDLAPGDYVMLSVADNGCGMDKSILANIFEPFFTTKEKFKGTGLGLSTVYGIVKQNGGFITVESKKGKGSTFRLYFPRYFSEDEI